MENKVDALLIVRGFACFCVVLAHVAGDLTPGEAIISVHGYDLTWLIRTTGALGVWLFFVLSGYLMGKGFYAGRYESTFKGSLRFYRNRLLRIYPLYVFSIFAVWGMTIRHFPFDTENLKTVIHLLCFSYYGWTYFPNTILWTISTEFRFYLLVPFLFILARFFIKDMRTYCLSMVLVMLPLIAYRLHIYMKFFGQGDFYPTWIHASYIPLRGNLDLFLSGLLLNFFPRSGIPNKEKSIFGPKSKKVLALSVFAAMLFFYNFVSYQAQLFMAPVYSPIFYIGMQTIVALAACFLIYQFEVKSDYMVSAVNWSNIKINPLRIFELFGILTYGIYIWHMPVLDGFSHTGIHIKNAPALFAVKLLYALSLSTALSTCTYFLIEKPFDKRKRAAVAKNPPIPQTCSGD